MYSGAKKTKEIGLPGEEDHCIECGLVIDDVSRQRFRFNEAMDE